MNFHTGKFVIFISSLSLTNFRNYSQLDIDLPLGTTLIHGQNGHGKSNLLEAIYMLAIAKSIRSSTERELIRKGTTNGVTYSKIAGVVEEKYKSTKLEIHYQCTPSENEAGFTAQKYIRVNNSPKRSSALVGILNAVIFTVNDLDVVYGRPSDRRRYLDILISQVDKEYFKNLREYSKITTQRNHLLRLIRDRNASSSELEFWDEKLSLFGTTLINQRIQMVNKISSIAEQIHRHMSSSNETLNCLYQITTQSRTDTLLEVDSRIFKEKLKECLTRDIAQGSTSFGPHRDDLLIRINGLDANRYASRGQSRTAILSLKFAEAQFLQESRLSSPLLLLDDVLSELDAARQEKIAETIQNYEQCIVTSVESESVPRSLFKNSTVLEINHGTMISNSATKEP